MCLSIAIKRPNDVLAHEEYAGHEFMIVHNGMGYRCGYVKVLPGHPWYGKEESDINVEVHGGLTFAQADVPCDKGGEDNGWWVGFDCAHAWDTPDPALPRQRGVNLPDFNCGEVRTQEYVLDECRSLCAQAAAVATVGSL